jgi:hypothetical protein
MSQAIVRLGPIVGPTKDKVNKWYSNLIVHMGTEVAEHIILVELMFLIVHSFRDADQVLGLLVLHRLHGVVDVAMQECYLIHGGVMDDGLDLLVQFDQVKEMFLFVLVDLLDKYIIICYHDALLLAYMHDFPFMEQLNKMAVRDIHNYLGYEYLAQFFALA